MTSRPSIAAVLAFLALSALSGCNPPAGPAATSHAMSPFETEPAGRPQGKGGATAINLLTIERRAVFMSGHVAAGLALYRAGEPEAAAPHLMHPVSEMHAGERDGFAALGFDASIFEAVSAALAEGRPAADVAPLLARAEENLAAVRTAAGGEAKDLIGFLLQTCAYEYDAGVTAGDIVNAGEYQDAFGFAVVARDIARDIEASVARELVLELELLVRMWPGQGPVTSEAPAPEAALAAQIARAELALSLLP